MGVTQEQWRDRVAAWHSFVARTRLSGYYPRGSAHRRLFAELKSKGMLVPDKNPPPESNRKYWIIKPGTTRMPAFVDPAHAWQIRAWQAMRWHADGVTARALCAVLGRSTVSLRQMRAWLHLLAQCDVVRKRRVTGLTGHFKFTIVGQWGTQPEPPHRHILRKALDSDN